MVNAEPSIAGSDPVNCPAGMLVASLKLNAGVASVSPKLRVTPPIAILEFDSLAFAIEPSS